MVDVGPVAVDVEPVGPAAAGSGAAGAGLVVVGVEAVGGVEVVGAGLVGVGVVAVDGAGIDTVVVVVSVGGAGACWPSAALETVSVAAGVVAGGIADEGVVVALATPPADTAATATAKPAVAATP